MGNRENSLVGTNGKQMFLFILGLIYSRIDFYLSIYWSENGELVCISTDESFFILKFCQEVVDAAKDNKDAVTEDGICLICNRLVFYL